jgi:hypothetical protein
LIVLILKEIRHKKKLLLIAGSVTLGLMFAGSAQAGKGADCNRTVGEYFDSAQTSGGAMYYCTKYNNLNIWCPEGGCISTETSGESDENDANGEVTRACYEEGLMYGGGCLPPGLEYD